jgi:hypothetical protein
MADSCGAVFFVTPLYKDTGYLEAEIDDALQQKMARGDGFALIALLIPDEHGVYGDVPAPLKKYAWKKLGTHLDGARYILESLPPHLMKTRRYLALPNVVPPAAKEVAILGQNLCTRLWLDEDRYHRALGELRVLLSRTSLQTVVLIMMTPKALLSIDPGAAKHMKAFSLPRLIQLANDLPGESRIKVTFHPSATLSLIAVDWTEPERAFALITPKFQQDHLVDARLSLLLDEREFDAASLKRMLIDAEEGKADASTASLTSAPALLDRLLRDAGL